MATYPSLVMAQQLAEIVKARLGLATVVSQDANGDPTVAVGPGTTNTDSAFIRIKARNAQLTNDIVGHTQAQYGKPHVAQVAVEGAATTGDVRLGSLDIVSILVAELARVGVRIELYVTANATLPTLANLNTEVNAGNVDASWEDLYYPIASTM